MSRLFTAAKPVAECVVPKRLYPLPADALQPCNMKRVIVHWTAGSYVASALDREHYHFLVQGDLKVITGARRIIDNVNVKGKSSDDYAAHTLNCNTGSIGVSICASAGAVEVPYDPGKYPVTEGQWQRTAEVVAALCDFYKIPVTRHTVLTHAEVQDNLGIKQRGKWDIARLPFNRGLNSAIHCGDNFRSRVQELL